MLPTSVREGVPVPESSDHRPRPHETRCLDSPPLVSGKYRPTIVAHHYYINNTSGDVASLKLYGSDSHRGLGEESG